MKTADKCPPASADLVAEAAGKPVIAGDTAVEVAGRLILQQKQTRDALGRSLAAYEACRAT